MRATWMGCSRWVEKLADGGNGISETTVVSAFWGIRETPVVRACRGAALGHHNVHAIALVLSITIQIYVPPIVITHTYS